MPKTRLLYEGLPDLLPMQGRSPGMHVSTIINDLCIQRGYYEEGSEFDRENNIIKTRMGLGNALEDAIIRRYHLSAPDRYTQPGELEFDGLFGTPDILDTFEYAIHEVKLTWKSATNQIDDQMFIKYLWQIMAYCRMAETALGYLHVCFVNGHYDFLRAEHKRDGRTEDGPTYRLYELQFSKRDLLDNWRMLKLHEADMKKRKKGKGAKR